MPSLRELKNPVAADAFVEAVARRAQDCCRDEVDLNDGLQTNQDLQDRLAKGDRIEFDYGRLLDESDKYE